MRLVPGTGIEPVWYYVPRDSKSAWVSMGIERVSIAHHTYFVDITGETSKGADEKRHLHCVNNIELFTANQLSQLKYLKPSLFQL